MAQFQKDRFRRRRSTTPEAVFQKVTRILKSTPAAARAQEVVARVGGGFIYRTEAVVLGGS